MSQIPFLFKMGSDILILHWDILISMKCCKNCLDTTLDCLNASDLLLNYCKICFGFTVKQAYSCKICLQCLRYSYFVLKLDWEQCDQIMRFIGLSATFQFSKPLKQLICPNFPNSQAIFVKVSKTLIFLVKSGTAGLAQKCLRLPLVF